MPIDRMKWRNIEKNMVEFNRGLHISTESLAKERFARFYHWYYHPRLDIFAPSKFIGYDGTTHEKYDGSGISGVETQKILRGYFDRVPSRKFNEYLNKLIEMADSHGYKVSKKTLSGSPGWIYIPKRWIMEQFVDHDASYEVPVDDEVSYEEGSVKYTFVNKYERNPKVKKAAILFHGMTCMGCGFNFEQFYGEHGKGFIEIHHLKPLSSVGEEHYVDPKEDIAVLCANCHRMVHHKRNEPLTMDELISIVEMNGLRQ